MFYRIPHEFLVEVKEVYELDIISSEGYRCSGIEEEDPFKSADEEYVNESVKE